MARNLRRYVRAWMLREKGKTLKEIGMAMGFTAERARILINYVRFSLRRKNEDSKIIARLRRSS